MDRRRSRPPRPVRTGVAATFAVALFVGAVAPETVRADDGLEQAEATLAATVEQIRDRGRAVDDRFVQPARLEIEQAAERVETHAECALRRVERLADVPVRYFATLPIDPERARRELRAGLDPTDVHSPLRALTRNEVLDLYMLVDWATPLRERGFTAVRPGVDADGRPIPIRYTRSPIVLLNGAMTDEDRALQTGQALADRLGAVVLVWHNQTNGCVGDACETLLNMADLNVGIEKELRSKLDEPRPITVIAHSQGGAQLHAILTNRQRRGLSNAHVACVLLGAPNAAETNLAVGKWTFLTHGDDPIPNLLGRNGLGGRLSDHAVEYYLPLIEPEMLW
ncbi:hypothetical protein [Alienimonas californiensis]|uniref:Alpha/beta hydrolase family protein n=1 Tax=Alienimonas californiensis TaxID=2527989 RepID=A0A517P7N7_9PLAN|nr:hypothetical protein [Alienimonas californiensis]QDT15394.1 hypothetical protein CA12_14790 [Alienimonas californiensis]